MASKYWSYAEDASRLKLKLKNRYDGDIRLTLTRPVASYHSVMGCPRYETLGMTVVIVNYII